MRGAAVIGLAVIAGVVGLQALDDASPAGVDGGSTTTTTSTTPGSTSSTVAGAAGSSTTARSSSTTRKTTTTKKSGTTSSTTTTVPARPTSQVAVWVANGSEQTGAANVLSQKLKGLGYNTLGISNAATRTGTVVHCKTGYDKEAAALATEVSSTAKVEPFPASVPTGAEAANCLVILGK